MGMRRLLPFCSHNDSCPSKFLYSDESLVNVRILGNEESPKMKGKFLWVENMRGSFGEDCRLSLTAGRSKLDEMHPQYVIFLTAKKENYYQQSPIEVLKSLAYSNRWPQPQNCPLRCSSYRHRLPVTHKRYTLRRDGFCHRVQCGRCVLCPFHSETK